MADDKHLDNVSKTLSYSTEQFDKSVLFVASGALGVSFAFIKELIPDLKEACATNLLIISWVIFAFVIFLFLLSHFVSTQANRWAYENSDLDFEEYKKGMDKRNYRIRAMNVTMIIGLFIGLLLFILFVNENI